MTPEQIISLVGAALFGGGTGIVGSFFFFKPKLRQEKADADIKETEARDKRHDYLEERIIKMEELYAKQGDQLDRVRKEMLTVMEKLGKVEQENVHLRNENEALKAENESLKMEVKTLRTEFDAYKQRKK